MMFELGNEFGMQKTAITTRIRTRKVMMSWQAMFLFVSCCLSVALALHDTDSLLHAFGEMQQRQVPSPRVRSSTRRVQDDKTDDKNNDKDATAAPTFVPTNRPAPSMAPSVKETPSPTAGEFEAPTSAPFPIEAPTSTPFPTVAPTIEVVENSVGNLIMEMSVSDPTVSASDVNDGQANTLLNGVLAGMLEVQCRLYFIMVLDDSVDATRACPDTFARRELQTPDKKENYPVVWTMSRVTVEDYQDENGDTLMYWTVIFPVLDIGEAYTQWAVEQSESTDEAEVNATALEGMYESAYYALQTYIQRGYMNKQLPETAVAVADSSVEDSEPAPAPGAYPSEQLDPDPFHAMRVAGMILLIVTLVTTLLLVILSARRQKERERDSAIAKINKGGLVTEEGLTLMLDEGRRESEKAGLTSTEIEVVLMQDGQMYTEENSSDTEEESRMLPMPGYLNNSMSILPPLSSGAPEDSKEGAVLKAAKDSTSNVDKTYPFLSLFGSHDDDSEPDDGVRPDERYESLEGTMSQTIDGFMNMFSASSGASAASQAPSSLTGNSNAPGSQAPSPDRKSNTSKDTVNL